MAGTPFGPGTVLAGRFTLEDLLDESDGARFWRATDRVLSRNVAVHVLPQEDARADALLAGARSSALVSDVHLLRVLDAAAADGVVYVVNEWCSGVSLDRLLVEGPLSARRAAWLVKEVADAITTAHRNGVAHGRLLPENVMVSDTGSVKLIGFVVDSVIRSPDGQRGVADGVPLTARQSDVLNLAALLYAALVGRWPGTAGSAVPPAPIEHGRPLRPRRVRAGVPRPLDAICEQVLNAGAHPGASPIETAREIQAALSDFIGGPGGATSWASGWGTSERTTVLDDADLPADEPTLPSASTDGDDGLEDTMAVSAPRRSRETDPDATQAGVPPHFDTDDRGDNHTDDHTDDQVEDREQSGPSEPEEHPWFAPRTRPAPPPPPDDQPARPLFADGGPASTSTAPWRTPRPDARRGGDDEADGADGADGADESFGRGSGPAEAAVAAPRARSAGSNGFLPGGARSTGVGSGPVPSAWGPDADGSPPDDGPDDDDDGRDDRVPGRTWLRLAVVLGVAVALVLGTVFAFSLGRGPGNERTPGASQDSSPTSSASTATGAKVPIRAVTDFDPEGDPPSENPDLAPLAADGKPGTAWHTSTYFDPLPALKKGVGLLVDLGRRATVRDVRVRLGGSPTAVRILAAPDATSAPTGTDGLDAVATDPTAGATADLRLRKPVTTRWLVVWLTSLPRAPGGYQGRVAEISVRS